MSLDLPKLLRQVEEHETGKVVLGLSRVEQLLLALNSPQDDLQIIHVAGTNGKGSVIAFLEAMLRQAGYPVAIYTSPHLIQFNERIQIDRTPIADAALAVILDRILTVCRKAKIPATFFEITTVAALCYFSQQGLGRQGKRPGIVILETGLGGRLDATNLITPLLCLISSIGRDHEDFLGDTLAKIAGEKAGILKAGIPAAAAPGNEEAARVIDQRAQALLAPLMLAGRDFNYQPPTEKENRWRYEDRERSITLPRPALLGRYQIDNGALAVAGIGLLRDQGFTISDLAVQKGVESAFWPGRLEWFNTHKVISRFSSSADKPLDLNGSAPLLLDGAHNGAAALGLADYLQSRFPPPHTFKLIFSALKNKDIPTIIRALSPSVDQVWTVSVGGGRGVLAEELAEQWRALGHHATPCFSSKEALFSAQNATPKEQRILVAGSLYLVGEVRSLL
ncbi:MAG: bifunctional folylpolyglutamate synthase/dihydrofolate synthase [Magnetococcales bacterium]|nr:bifunctional folylpolyglutamate synthase/dihydrofolate synthase [Magnetococcales bacterium]